MGMLLAPMLLAVSAAGLLPSDDVAADQVDMVEVNHYYDDEARHVFDQLIFYDWSASENRFQVRAWRLLKSSAQLPSRNWASGGYDVIWHDGEVTRKVQAKAMRETWTQHDPEMRERSYLPKEQRRRLYTPRIETQLGEGG